MQQTPDPLSIGAVLAVVGMGGTLLTLYLLGLLVSLMKRIFPIELPPPPAAAASPSTGTASGPVQASPPVATNAPTPTSASSTGSASAPPTAPPPPDPPSVSPPPQPPREGSNG
jgi:hypothetical protein